jgi:hypothetical protein
MGMRANTGAIIPGEGTVSSGAPDDEGDKEIDRRAEHQQSDNDDNNGGFTSPPHGGAIIPANDIDWRGASDLYNLTLRDSLAGICLRVQNKKI